MRSKNRYIYWYVSLFVLFQIIFPILSVQAESVIKNISATALVDGLKDSGTVFSYTSKDTITATTPKSNIYNFKLNPDLLVFFENKTIENERPCSEEYICFFFDGTISTPSVSSEHVMGYISVSTLNIEKGKATIVIDSGTANLGTLDGGSFNISNAGTFADGTDYKVSLKDIKINGEVKLISIDGSGSPQLGDNGFFAMFINIYSYDGDVVGQGGVNGAKIDKNQIQAGVYKYNQMTLTEALYSNTVYTLQIDTGAFNSDNLYAINCSTYEIDITAPCKINYTGTVDFTIDANGKITIINGTDFEKKSNGINITSLTTESGLNLEITEGLNSPLDKALSSAVGAMIKFVNSTTDWVVGGINSLLNKTEDYVLGAADRSTKGVEPAWTKMRNIGLTLLIMALVIIAFANVLQIDIEHYGLNRMIPRIIISIIMAYLSWLIVTFFFDFARALQDQAGGLIAGNALPMTYLSGAKIAAPSAGNILGELGSILLLIALFIGILICGVILYFSLIIRIVVLSFLLAVAPLAFILNIVPFTSNLYKQWWSEFFKWMFMGPIVVVILALGSIIASSATLGNASSFSTTDATTGANMMIGLLIFGASMYFAAMLPQKWGGKIMGSWQKAGKGLGKWAGNTTGLSGARKLVGDRIGTWSNNRQALAANRLARLGTLGKVGTTADVLRRQQFDAAVTEAGKQIGVASSDQSTLISRFKTAKSGYEKSAIMREMAARGDFEKLYAPDGSIDMNTGSWVADSDDAQHDARVDAGTNLMKLMGKDQVLEKSVLDNQGELVVAARNSLQNDQSTTGDYARAKYAGLIAGQRNKSLKEKRMNILDEIDPSEISKFMTEFDMSKMNDPQASSAKAQAKYKGYQERAQGQQSVEYANDANLRTSVQNEAERENATIDATNAAIAKKRQMDQATSRAESDARGMADVQDEAERINRSL